jgi:metal iron transporter
LKTIENTDSQTKRLSGISTSSNEIIEMEASTMQNSKTEASVEQVSSEDRGSSLGLPSKRTPGAASDQKTEAEVNTVENVISRSMEGGPVGQGGNESPNSLSKRILLRVRNFIVKFPKFVGPGFLVSVAYIDPGNYATDVAAGASFRYQLLFVVLLSNLIAVFLQSLCVKLGTVTGMDLAQNCKAHLPWYLNYFFYFFAEAAIIATDIAEVSTRKIGVETTNSIQVIGTAIALNILIKVPLVAGCALAIADVLFILLFYNPSGMSMKALRIFECFVVALVLAVVICFCYELSLIQNTHVKEIMRGYLPSSAVLNPTG